MKICQLCAVDFTLKHFLLPLIDGMEKKGWVVETVCSYGEYIDDLKKDGYIIKNLNIPRSVNPIRIFFAIFQLYKLIKKEKYDIVHTHTPVASIIGRLACKLAGVPIVIYTAHGFYFHENMSFVKYHLFLNLERLAGLFTHLLFTQSLEDFEVAVKYRLAPKEKIFAIGNGVNKGKFNPTNIKNSSSFKLLLQIPENSYIVGCIARLIKEKGLIELLNAAIKINKKNKNVYFLFVGERLKSDHNQNIQRKILYARKILKDNLIFLGKRNDIPEIISIMDVFCLPSWREGMPRSIIEAMMMEKPVIATDIRGSREEVVNNETGLIIPVKSSFEIENALIKMMKNKKLATKFGKEGRKRALKLYDEDKIINLQIDIIANEIKFKGIV